MPNRRDYGLSGLRTASLFKIRRASFLSALTLSVCLLFLLSTPSPTLAQTSVIYLTSGTTWTVPSGWNNTNNTIEVIGAGGESSGIGGSGGGSYSRISNLSLTPGSRVTYQVGAAGGSIKTTGATWFNGTSISNASVSAEGGCSATATSGCTNSTTSNVGTIVFAGGKGAGGNKGLVENSGGGGGGAGGPHGVGAPGTAGTDSSAGSGGAADNGFGGAGGAGGSPLSGGGAGAEYYTAGGVAAGSGGGGGGLYYLGPGSGGNYGGGSGGAGNAAGGNGLIVITYAPSPALFVANSSFTAFSSPPVTAYPLSSNGNIAPLPSATPTPATGLSLPDGIARDSNRQYLRCQRDCPLGNGLRSRRLWQRRPDRHHCRRQHRPNQSFGCRG